MKTLALGLVSASLLFSSAAFADAPKFGELPKGAMSSPPEDSKKPASIPAKEKVEGFNIGAPKFDKKTPPGSRHVAVFSTAAQADAMTKGEFQGDDSGSICFTEASRRGGGPDDEDDDTPPERDWETNQQSQVYLWLKAKDNPSSGIMAIHSEKLVEKDGAASLETADAWVDPNTKGVRLIGKSSLPLKMIGSAMHGVRVFAARDERTGGKKRVQFIFVRDTDGQHKQVRAQGMMAVLTNGLGAMSSGCQHLRVSLPVEDKGGESAIITATVELPSTDPEAQKKPEVEKKAKPGAVKATMHHGRMLGMGGAGVTGGTGEERELRLRELQASIGVSKSTKDKEPLISMSFGWAARETTQRVFDTDD